MNNDGNWDDTIIMKQFDAAFRSHISKRKGETDDNKIKWVGIGQPSAWEPVQQQHNNSNNNINNNAVRNDSNYINNNIPSSTSNGIPSNKPIIDEALQEMLAAWYQSGYATGRYHAFKEMEEGKNNNI